MIRIVFIILCLSGVTSLSAQKLEEVMERVYQHSLEFRVKPAFDLVNSVLDTSEHAKAYLERGKLWVWMDNIYDQNGNNIFTEDGFEEVAEVFREESPESIVEWILHDLNKALELDPTLRGAYYHRGVYFRDANSYTEAIDDFTSAIELDTSDYSLYWERAYVLFELGSYERAVADYDQALKKLIDPKQYGEILYSRAYALYMNKEFERAMIDLEKLDNSPSWKVSAKHLKAMSYFESSSIMLACKEYHELREIAPEYVLTYDGYGCAEHYLNSPDFKNSALKRFREGTFRYSDFPDCLITRTDKEQLEEFLFGSIRSKIKWNNPREYVLTIVETDIESYQEFIGIDIVVVITHATDKAFSFEYSLENGLTQSGTMYLEE